MLLSFHPMLQADKYRICAGRGVDARDRELMRWARAVLLPQHRHRELHLTALRLCPNVFPDYRLRNSHPGKIGDVQLFRELGLPHPASWTFASAEEVPDTFWDKAP